MSAISSGKTPLLPSDFKDRLQNEDADYAKPSSTLDFLRPFKIVLPKYAKDYEGSYYEVPSQTSAPTAFPTEQYSSAYGKFYEIAYPSDAIDDGISAIEVSFGATGIVDQSHVLEKEEPEWVVDGVNTQDVYWHQAGRKIRMYVPSTYASSGTLKHAEGYTRFPTIPDIISDPIDAPAEDVETLYGLWKEAVIK